MVGSHFTAFLGVVFQCSIDDLSHLLDQMRRYEADLDAALESQPPPLEVQIQPVELQPMQDVLGSLHRSLSDAVVSVSVERQFLVWNLTPYFFPLGLQLDLVQDLIRHQDQIAHSLSSKLSQITEQRYQQFQSEHGALPMSFLSG